MGSLSPLLFIGMLAIFFGAYKVFLEKERPGRLIVWGALVDSGLILTGVTLGGSGAAGGVLMLLYHGLARIAAWVALAGMIPSPLSAKANDIRGMIWHKPIHAILFGFALLATLGVSPIQTPNGILFVFHAIASKGTPVPILLVAIAYCALIWRTAELILTTCFVSQNETSAQPDPLHNPNPTRFLIALMTALFFLGLFRGIVQDSGIFIAGLRQIDVPHFVQSLHWSTWVLLLAAFVLPCKRIIPAELQGAGAIAVMVLAFILVCTGRLTPMGRFFGLMVTLVGFVVTCASVSSIKTTPRTPWYWFLTLIFFAFALGAVTTTNIGQLASCMMVLGWAGCFLVAWECTPKARAAALTCALIWSGTALIAASGLFAIGDTHASFGPTFKAVFTLDATLLRGALFLTLIGCAAKAGLIPFHQWIAESSVAPAPVTAMLSGIFTKLGIYGLIVGYFILVGTPNLVDLGTVAGISTPGALLISLGLASMFYGEIMALREDDLKRLLSYATIAQIGEIMTVLGIGTWLATAGALTHVFNHTVMTTLLFLCAGGLILRVGSSSLQDLGGLVRRMPWTAGCMTIGLLSLMGLPPFNGFISKYIMIVACVDAGFPALATALLTATVLSAIYCIRILRTILLDPEPCWRPQIADAPLSIQIPAGILALICVLFGILPQLGLSLVLPAVDFLSLTGRMNHDILPRLSANWPLYVLVPLLGALVPVWFRHDRIRAAWGSIAVLAITTALILLFGHRLDMLSYIMALAIPVMGIINLIYAVAYMEHSHTQWRFYSFFLLLTGGLLGVATSSDLFSFFLFWEIMSSWTLYFAISHEGTPAAMREGFKYFLYNIIGAAVIFLGVGIIAAHAGSVAFDRIGSTLLAMNPPWATAVIALLALGFCMKAAQLTFRLDWQMYPELAPAPVSSYISSVLLKIAVFGLIKLFLVFGGPALEGAGIRHLADVSPFTLFHQDTIMSIVAWIGAFTLLYGATQALVQVRLKRIFIWSTVSQIGYMVLGVAVGTTLGMAGGLLHMLNHMFFKDLLLLMIGTVMFRTHAETIMELGSIGKKMPLTMLCFFIGALAAVGVPPTNGFTSKWLIYQALMAQGEPLLAFISLIGSVVTLAYLARFMHVVFLGQPVRSSTYDHITEAPRSMLIPMFILAALTILTGIFPGILLYPINTALTEFGMPALAVSLTGITSGAGAWNATLITVLMLVSFGGIGLALRRFLAHASIRETGGHACGHDPELVTTRIPSGSVFAVFARLCAKLSFGERHLDENQSGSN